MTAGRPGVPILGLDLGTAKACVSAVDDQGRLRLLADQRGETIIPAYISFHPDGNVLVGRDALVRRSVDPDNTIRRELEPPGAARITRAGRTSMGDLCSVLLDHMRRLADAALRTDSRKVVLTVPWGYGDDQRQSLVEGARGAGLEIVDILSCPMAAAYAYGLESHALQFVAICDFGASKLECSILAVGRGRPQVLAAVSDMELGGDDITNRLVDWMVDGFAANHQIDLRGDRVAMERFRIAAEESKRRLATSGAYGVQVEVPAISFGSDGSHVGLHLLLGWDVFDQLTGDLLDRALRVCQHAVHRAGIDIQQIAQVIAVGGTMRLPPLRERMAAFFGRSPRMDVDPEAACALGAALYAPQRAVLSDRITSRYGAVSPPPDSEVTAPTVGRTTHGRVGRVITKKMFTAVMPAQPDPEAEALDALGTAPAPTLVEVTASRLALGTVSGYCDEIVPADCPVPTAQTRVFTTGKDDQPTVVLRICQGESRRFEENMPLGTITLVNLPPRPRGQVKIAVTFAIDDDGVLTAGARDEATGQEQHLRIELPRAPTGNPV